MPETALPISETFLSIQGEGKLTGVPSYFIRVSGCNLRCAWCDTPYASWYPEGAQRTVASLASDAAASGARHAVLTGGEPLLFAAIVPLSRALRDAGMHITIETAGTVVPDDAPALACDLMSISPKLSNSTPRAGDPRDPAGAWTKRHEERRLNPAAIAALMNLAPDRQLKFVVSSRHDLEEIDALLGALPKVAPTDVLLMPEGVTVEQIRSRDWLVAECLRRGWRFCNRLHIELFGHTRGT